MNNVLKTSLLTLLFAVGFASTSSAQTKLATADLRKLFENYWKTKLSDASLKAAAADLEKDHKSLLESYTKATEDWKKLVASSADVAISDTERDRRKRDADEQIAKIEGIKDQIKQFEASAKETLATQQGRLRKKVLDEILPVINSIAQAEGYELVLDTAADSMNGTSVVLFSAGKIDLTEKVLAKLNADAPPAATTATNKPAVNPDARSGGGAPTARGATNR